MHGNCVANDSPIEMMESGRRNGIRDVAECIGFRLRFQKCSRAEVVGKTGDTQNFDELELAHADKPRIGAAIVDEVEVIRRRKRRSWRAKAVYFLALVHGTIGIAIVVDKNANETSTRIELIADAGRDGFCRPPNASAPTSALLWRDEAIVKREWVFQQPGNAIDRRDRWVVGTLTHTNVDPSKTRGPSTGKVAGKPVVIGDEIIHDRKTMSDECMTLK